MLIPCKRTTYLPSIQIAEEPDINLHDILYHIIILYYNSREIPIFWSNVMVGEERVRGNIEVLKEGCMWMDECEFEPSAQVGKVRWHSPRIMGPCKEP